MKKNRLTKITGILLILALITCCVISGTLAKYTSTTEKTATARVAKFDVAYGTSATTLDLFDTLYEADTETAETDVFLTAGDTSGDKLIAPGTGGKFTIALTDNSEVTVKADLAFTITNSANIPVVFSVDDGTTWTSTLTTINVTAGNVDEYEQEVLWKWDYEKGADAAAITANDVIDTGYGTATTPATLTVKVTATFTQVD